MTLQELQEQSEAYSREAASHLGMKHSAWKKMLPQHEHAPELLHNLTAKSRSSSRAGTPQSSNMNKWL
jgi:hypothetical protein